MGVELLLKNKLIRLLILLAFFLSLSSYVSSKFEVTSIQRRNELATFIRANQLTDTVSQSLTGMPKEDVIVLLEPLFSDIKKKFPSAIFTQTENNISITYLNSSIYIEFEHGRLHALKNYNIFSPDYNIFSSARRNHEATKN